MIFPSGFCISAQSTSFGQLRGYGVCWNLESFQTGKGFYRCQVNTIHTGNMQLSSCLRSTGILVHGGAPRGCITFGTLPWAQSTVHFGGGILGAQDVVAVRDSEEIEFNTLAGSHILTLSVESTTLERRAQVLLGSPVDEWRNCERLQMPHRERFNHLNRILIRYLKFGLCSSVTAQPETAQRLEGRIMEVFLLSLAPTPLQASRPKRILLAKQAEEYLRAHADLPVSVTELCETIGANQRTLFLGFHERYGITPMAYFKAIRLNRARRDLVDVDPTDPRASVTRVATRWGFCHLGRFSVEYRALFGESPIETLKKPSGKPRAAQPA